MSESKDSDQVKIAKSKHKTVRYALFLGVFAIIALTGLYFVFGRADSKGDKKVSFDLSKGTMEFSVAESLVDQAKPNTGKIEMNGSEVQFSAERLPATIVAGISAPDKAAEPRQFTGKNLINYEKKYVIGVPRPDHWELKYFPIQMSYEDQTIHELSDGLTTIDISVQLSDLSFDDLLAEATQALQRDTFYIDPVYETDRRSGTIFFGSKFGEMGIWHMKKILYQGVIYDITGLHINDPDRSEAENEQLEQEMVDMIASFSLFD